MKKSLFALTAAVLLNTVVPASHAEEDWVPMLAQGTKELSVAGRVEFLKIDSIDYDLALSYGYFVRDGWEIGVQVGGSDSLGSHMYDIGVFTEYNFNRDQKIVPYLGAGVAAANVNYDDSLNTSTPLNDEDGVIFDVEAGVKWFLRPYMAISTAVNFQVATEDLFATEDQIKDNVTIFNIGMRFYF